MTTITYDTIIKNYNLLSHHDPTVRDQANLLLISVIDYDNIWTITQQMITKPNNPNFQLLGSQLLFQKIQRDLSCLTDEQLHSLRQFIFNQLANTTLTQPTIDKLSSSGSLVAAALFLKHWPTLVFDLVKFMEVNAFQLRSGLMIFMNLPQEMRKTNRIRQGDKFQIRQKMLGERDLIGHIFQSALSLNEPIITKYSLQALQNWIKIGFPLLKYENILKRVISLTGQFEQYLQACCKVISEGLHYACNQKCQSLSEIDIFIERDKYDETQLNSIKCIITYLSHSKSDFLLALAALKNIEQIQLYLSIVQELLLSFGFLRMTDEGKQLVDYMIKTFQSNNLKLSSSTFQFWVQFCQKVNHSRKNLNNQNLLGNVIQTLFQILLKKTLLQNDARVFNTLRDQQTIDDIDTMSPAQYRKQAQHLFSYIYEYITRKNENNGPNLYFMKLIYLVNENSNNSDKWRYIQLVIYAVKSSLQSMIKEKDNQNIIKFIQFILSQTINGGLPLRVAGQILILIKECGREMKQNQALLMKCLSYSLGYVSDQTLCLFAVYAFQSIMDAIGNAIGQNLIRDLLDFYASKKFDQQMILQKILDAILNSITRLADKNKMADFLGKIITCFQGKSQSLMNLNIETNYSLYVTAISQIKILLDCYQHLQVSEKAYFKQLFAPIAKHGILISQKMFENCMIKKLKCSNINQLTQSLLIVKNTLPLLSSIVLQQKTLNGYVSFMNLGLVLISNSDKDFFFEYSCLFDLIGKILNEFANKNVPVFNHWLVTNLPQINAFFLGYFTNNKDSLQAIDPDIIKFYFQIQQNVLIYSKQIYLSQPNHQQIYQLSIFSLKHLNQKNLQRRLINYLFACILMGQAYNSKFQEILQITFQCIPYINSICYGTLGKIFFTLFANTNLQHKQIVFRQLLQMAAYSDLKIEIKNIMAKFIAFTVETKIQRFLKGSFVDLMELKTKNVGSDCLMHIQLRFVSWKKQFNRILKANQPLQ